ncbi:hypothetical protein BGY98DRAFT_1022997, partial [Russula aff. rugulosa BPL654]
MGERHKDTEESSVRVHLVVQCRDLASTMRSALTTRSLANCASLILKTRLRTRSSNYPCPRATLRTSST